MGAANTREITAAEWLDVRDAVADVVQKAARNTQRQTVVSAAEALLRKGYVDVAAVRAAIVPVPDIVAEEEAS